MVKKVNEPSRGDCEVPEVWTFTNDDVANKFQHHVTHQLPWYNTCTEFVQSLVTSYLVDDTTMYDIGASKGNITTAITNVIEAKGVDCIAIEPVPQMVAQYQGAGQVIESTVMDYMTSGAGFKGCSVSVCFLSLMFMTKHERSKLLTALKQVTCQGGAIIIVDKEAPKGGYIGTALARARQQLKANQGVPLSEIAAKELSLAGVQRPIEEGELGDEWVEFFRMGEFVGWIFEQK